MSLPPVQPTYILRGHESQIHSVKFIRSNSRLVTGDADGWLVVWSLATKRAVASWRAHQGTILGVDEWGPDKLISHGKDNKLVVWQLGTDDEPSLSTTLPSDATSENPKHPWLLHSLQVNTMNFCSFAICDAGSESKRVQPEDESNDKSHEGDFLIAVPNILSSETVDIFHLPSERRLHTIPKDKSLKSGMVMAVRIFWKEGNLTVVSGYESGHTSVSVLEDDNWVTKYLSHPHEQPILSLDVEPGREFYLTSSADALLIKNPIPANLDVENHNIVIPASQPKPPAVVNPSGLSQLLAQANAHPELQASAHNSRATRKCETNPLRVIHTKHSGQQSLRIRSDGKIFATAGWDSKIRVYSTKTMKELAVLKWHREGCYAVDFAIIKDDVSSHDGEDVVSTKDHDSTMAVVPRITTLNIREKRVQKAESTHWLAAGSKDGKVSLWDIY